MKKKPDDAIPFRDLVEHVRRLVADSGVTQTYLAGKLGVPQPLISRALTVDHARPVPATVMAIARELGEEWEEVVTYQRKAQTRRRSSASKG
jgi:transcriptional regulator with XRE-family HTH domain